MMSPEAFDFAWTSWRSGRANAPAPALFAPFRRARPHMRAHDGGVEHLNGTRRRADRRERVEERLEDASLAQAIEAFPHAVPMTEALRQSAPAERSRR